MSIKDSHGQAEKQSKGSFFTGQWLKIRKKCNSSYSSSI